MADSFMTPNRYYADALVSTIANSATCIFLLIAGLFMMCIKEALNKPTFRALGFNELRHPAIFPPELA